MPDPHCQLEDIFHDCLSLWNIEVSQARDQILGVFAHKRCCCCWVFCLMVRFSQEC